MTTLYCFCRSSASAFEDLEPDEPLPPCSTRIFAPLASCGAKVTNLDPSTSVALDCTTSGLLAALSGPDCVSGVMGVASRRACHRARNEPGPGEDDTSGVGFSLISRLVSDGSGGGTLRGRSGGGLLVREGGVLEEWTLLMLFGRWAVLAKSFAIAGARDGWDRITLSRRAVDWACIWSR